MRRFAPSPALVAALTALVVALGVGLAPAASQRVFGDALRALARAGELDGREAARVADEVQPVLAQAGDEDGVALARRLRDAKTPSDRKAAAEDLAAHLGSLASLEKTDGPAAIAHDPALLERIMAEEGLASGSEAQRILRDLQKRLQELFDRFLARWLGSEAASKGFAALYYVVLALSGLVTAWLVWRVLSALLGRPARGRRGRREGEPEAGAPVVEAARDLPADALAYADAAADEGRFREAVRALFGGAARSLVERGVLPVTRTRTTSEILHDLAERAPHAHPALAALAGVFEPAWYGHRDPGPDGYAAARCSYIELETVAGARR
ncbi:MAG: DUF4129 domain-containing protein [Coriobacteriia bacterium]|nr:DUF4129 domain-containing protein [Coriobacteriia bacterium]